MSQRVFLSANRSKMSVNATNFLETELEKKERVLQGSNIIDNCSLYDIYNAERDACNKFRMIFVVNPVCSNVLFNMRTEVIATKIDGTTLVLNDNEGYNRVLISSNIQNSSEIDRKQAIRDTEYSHPLNGNFIYNCGIDIFNNHMLRNKGFVHVNKMSQDSKNDCEDCYNTIKDYERDNSGKIVTGVVNYSSNNSQKLHLYTADTIMTLKDAYLNHIKEVDGWIGFTNPGYINIPNSSKNNILINRLINNKKPCAFIDMYPDRTLYSFVPKYNEKYKRVERNWDYCITYPYENDTEKINDVLGGQGGAIKADVSEGVNSSSVEILMCRSLFKHTLNVGDYITVYYWDNSGEDNIFTKHAKRVKILSVGNYDNSERDRFFTIRKSDVEEVLSFILEGGLFYKKISHGVECEYYFRKYKKLMILNPDDTESEPKSDLNKVAYGENIYGDRVAQIMYTDDIDVEGLHDHLGRPLTEVFLTIVKRNAGYREWSAGTYDSEVIEMSHCFGKNTAGVDFGTSSGAQYDYNIRRIHNIDYDNRVGYKALGDIWVNDRKPYTLDDDITISGDSGTFWGDVVEFDAYNYEEHEISKVYFRFNTLQRECDIDDAFFYDKFEYDDYDVDANGRSIGFSVKEDENVFNKAYVNNTRISIPSCLCPEGYFYNPHNPIKIRETATNTTSIRGKWVNFLAISGDTSGENTILNIKAPVNYGFINGDYFAFCINAGFYGSGDTRTYEDSKIEWGRIISINELEVVLEFEGKPFGEHLEDIIGNEKKAYRAFFSKETVPTYARFHSETNSFVWRGIVPASEMSNDMSLYDTPFSNGRFYIEQNVTFFLRRQDPIADFGLQKAKTASEDKVINPMEFFRIGGDKIDLSQVFNFYNNLDYTCY